jgi:hypothetical protein
MGISIVFSDFDCDFDPTIAIAIADVILQRD